jgi:signal transduction histidine kinase
VDIDNELLRLVRRWAPTAEREWSVRSGIGAALISPDRFEAALDCLVENAIKFTKPGQRIEVIGTRVADAWKVEVRDFGVGIDPDTAHGLLASPPGRGTGTGTGLGLAIVRAVAESLDGQVTITGAPGEGTAVTLVVPQTPLEPFDQAPRDAATTPATGPGSRR